jgi:protein-L-isoaspartate(D-aspartate) O-methyltransferase
MISCQVRPNRMRDESVTAALAAVPREFFVSKALQGVAYLDTNLEMAPDCHLMAPTTLARLLAAAQIRPSDVVLEVGCGSGYEAAVMAQLADAVIAVENNPELVERATKKLLEAGIDNVAVVEGSLKDGVGDQGPFQVIFINGAVEEMQQSLVDQLDENGRLVCIRVDRGVGRGHILSKSGGEISMRDLFDADAPVLSGFEKAAGFSF